jgi:hypothetical protein
MRDGNADYLFETIPFGIDWEQAALMASLMRRPNNGPIDKLCSRPLVPRKWTDRSRHVPHQGKRELARLMGGTA